MDKTLDSRFDGIKPGDFVWEYDALGDGVFPAVVKDVNVDLEYVDVFDLSDTMGVRERRYFGFFTSKELKSIGYTEQRVNELETKYRENHKDIFDLLTRR